MASRLGPLLLGAGALLLLSRRARAEPTEEPASKPKPKPKPEPESKPGPGAETEPGVEPEPGPEPGPELEEALLPGEYTAKDGERVLLSMSIPDVGPILGMLATRDGVPIENIYSGLLSGFELEYREHGVEVEFFQEGVFELFAIPIVANFEEQTVNYEASLSSPRVWKFLVEGKVNA